MSKQTIYSVFFLITCLFSFSASAKERIIVNNDYNVSVPSLWTEFDGKTYSSLDDSNFKCTYLRNPKNQYQNFAIAMCVVNSSVLDTLKQIGFHVIDNVLVRPGSMDTGDAKIEIMDQHVVAYASASCGITDGAGFHPAGGNCYSAVIFGRDYNVTIETDGTEPLDEIKEIMKSMHIKTPGDTRKITDDLKKITDEQQ